jgi:hypothetical protein
VKQMCSPERVVLQWREVSVPSGKARWVSRWVRRRLGRVVRARAFAHVGFEEGSVFVD